MDQQQDDDLYLPYGSLPSARQPHYHQQQEQYMYGGPSYSSPSYAPTESAKGGGFWSMLAALFDCVTSPSFGVMMAIFVICVFQFRGTLVGLLYYLRQQYEYYCDDEVIAVDRLDDAFMDEDDSRRFPTRPRALLLMSGRILVDMLLWIADILRAYYQIACEVLRNSTGIIQWIPGLSNYYNSDDGAIRMMARYGAGGANYIGNAGFRNRQSGNGYLGLSNSNEPPPLETPDEDENDYCPNTTVSLSRVPVSNTTNGASYALRSRAEMTAHAATPGDGTITGARIQAPRTMTTSWDNTRRFSGTDSRQDPERMPSPELQQQPSLPSVVQNQVALNQDDIEPAFLNDQDYPPGWLVYHPLLGVVSKEDADKYDKDQQERLERTHMPSFQSSITAGGT